MSPFLVGAIAVAAASASHPPTAEAETPLFARRFPTVWSAVAATLENDPVVVAFGELHQTRSTAGVPSALRRFTEEIWPEVAGRFSHLVVETWIATGRCGDAERSATEDLQRATERPVATGGEIETLLRAAAARGIAPRILSVTCADYASMLGTGPGVDYDRALRVTERALEATTLAALKERWRWRSPVRPGLAIYGGALHNDVYPLPGLAPYSFAPKLMAATLGRYVEIDLIVPEYAAQTPSVRAQPWWRLYLRARSKGRSQGRGRGPAPAPGSDAGPAPPGVGADATVMISRGPRSFVIILPWHDQTP